MALPRSRSAHFTIGRPGLIQDRYRRIYEEELLGIYARIAEKSEDLIETYGGLEAELAERVRALMPEMRAGEAAGALRNVAVSKAVSIDKASVIRGRPTEIREERTMVDVARSLQRFAGIVKVNPELIAGTAEEIPERAEGES